jgi:hypothetical protein
MAFPDDLIEGEPVGDPLPLDYGQAGLQRRTCWYCGGGEGPFETEHQVPVSRGDKWGANVVDACASRNHLKGRLTVDEFRRALAVRLGVPEVTFAGEAGEGRPATPIRSIRSLGADREVVRVDPLAADRLSRAVRFLRRMGRPSFTAKDAVTDAVHHWCDELAAKYLEPGEDFPADGGAPSLFGDHGGEQSTILQPGELSSTPKVPLAREVTRISGPVLERARRAVAVLRQGEDPDLLLMGFVDAAVLRLVPRWRLVIPNWAATPPKCPRPVPSRTDLPLPSLVPAPPKAPSRREERRVAECATGCPEPATVTVTMRDPKTKAIVEQLELCEAHTQAASNDRIAAVRGDKVKHEFADEKLLGKPEDVRRLEPVLTNPNLQWSAPTRQRVREPEPIARDTLERGCGWEL